jgi:hypothetical protein
VKRDSGCTEFNGTYSSGGDIFSIICDWSWDHGYRLYLTYTVDFASCINGCVSWNTKSSDKCAGVQWIYGTFGPLGETGGSGCYFLWDMPGAGASTSGIDSGKMILVFSCITFTNFHP